MDFGHETSWIAQSPAAVKFCIKSKYPLLRQNVLFVNILSLLKITYYIIRVNHRKF